MSRAEQSLQSANQSVTKVSKITRFGSMKNSESPSVIATVPLNVTVLVSGLTIVTSAVEYPPPATDTT